jgi:uncharacterized OsmC-like protein
MVNRAMMVARSMGLHSTSIKINGSPKSARKRITDLASECSIYFMLTFNTEIT